MPHLLDTSVFLSAAIAPERLSKSAQRLLSEPESSLYLSAASSWEISIKFALRRLNIPDIPARWVSACLQRLDVRSLDVTHPHAFEVAELPLHHQDPFDRVLIAQAKVERLTLLTTDRIFEKYPVDVFLCGA